MAQAFVTTYNNDYRRHLIDRRHIVYPGDKFAEQLPEGDIWIIRKKIGEDDGEGGSSLAAAEAAVHRMYKKRLWSTYQVEYCPEMMPKESDEEEAEHLDNALLFYCKALYGARKQKIPPPQPGARRLYGYIRPSRMYVPLTTYQNDFGKVAYQILDAHSAPKSAPGLENVGAETKRGSLGADGEQLKGSQGKSVKPKVLPPEGPSGGREETPPLEKTAKLSSCACELKRKTRNTV